jgi:luciferase family oxidoreductase group 1
VNPHPVSVLDVCSAWVCQYTSLCRRGIRSKPRRGWLDWQVPEVLSGPVGIVLEVRLSLLDLVLVRTDQSSRDAVAASIRLAEAADRLGYTRFWTAEHHNSSVMASTSPAVMIAYLAARTSKIRLGSGGVMLPNHPPLIVAEQFALLEAVAPGRIDLGVGRAPGSHDQLATAALRGSHDADTPDSFASHIDEVAALMSADGIAYGPGADHDRLTATPAATTTPPIWVLGSSASSARLAAEKGLPYVYAHHFGRGGTHEALAQYREHFAPGGLGSAPVTMLTVAVAVAPTRAEAEAATLPMLTFYARVSSGLPLGRIALVEDAQAAPPLQSSDALDAFKSHAIVGTPDQAADQLRSLAAEFDVDEVMVCPVASERRGVHPATAPARETTLELLAEELL